MIHCYIIQVAIDSETSFEYVIFFPSAVWKLIRGRTEAQGKTITRKVPILTIEP